MSTSATFEKRGGRGITIVLIAIFAAVMVLTAIWALKEEPSSFFFFLKVVAINVVIVLASKSLNVKERRKKENKLRIDKNKKITKNK